MMSTKIPAAIRLLFCFSLACSAWAQTSHGSSGDGAQSSPLPRPNQCQSLYDSFYENEPGVYAYWALCESEPAEIGLDTLGAWPLAHGFTKGAGIHGGAAGPVPDKETAAQTSDNRSKLERQGIFLNKHAGAVALWLNAGATDFPVSAESFVAINGKSSVKIEALKKAGQQGVCFRASLQNTDGKPFDASACGLQSDTWYRVAASWNGSTISLYVNGSLRASAPYSGTLDDAIFYYQLFAGCCDTGKQMSIAKALISNRSWSASVAATDFKPTLTPPPDGGVLITPEKMGTIHRAVLGYVDNNQDLSPAPLSALLTGLKKAGVTALRYTGGDFADAADWRNGGTVCTAKPTETARSKTGPTGNTLRQYMETVAKPLHLDVDVMVNYGSNPPACDAGGDPQRNGADLVHFANREHSYGIKRWEIGNEQYAYGGGPNFDLHPNKYISSNGHERSTYSDYEPAFYKAMKTVDPDIAIAVPSVGPDSGYDPVMNYELPLLKQAAFDALVFHSYPVTDPITDGATLYPERVAAGTEVRGALLSVQTQLLNSGKSPGALWITEWNAEVSGNRWSKQTMGGAMPLYSAMQLAEFMQAGTEFATWQAQGEADVCSTYNYDPEGESAYSSVEGCGNTALVYTGRIANVGEKNVGLRPGDLTPVARGFQVLSQSGFVTEGESMVHVDTDRIGAPWLAAYAATHKGSYAVLLINRDRENAHTVPLRFTGRQPNTAGEVWSYGRPQYDESRHGNWQAEPILSHLAPSQGKVEVTLPPFSINVVIFE
jgi:hypothetical protein